MKHKDTIPDHPGVYLPPPFFYLMIFVVGWILQKWIPLSPGILRSFPAAGLGVILLIAAIGLISQALKIFYTSGNTVITSRAATSLQTDGIYSKTRNPMYLGMVFIYVSFSLFIGFWWHLILLPFLIILVQYSVIRKEENYLTHRFGMEYLDYQKKVGRWL